MDDYDSSYKEFQDGGLLDLRANWRREITVGLRPGASGDNLHEIIGEQMVVPLCPTEEHSMGRLPSTQGDPIRISLETIRQIPNDGGGEGDTNQLCPREDIHNDTKGSPRDIRSLGVSGFRMSESTESSDNTSDSYSDYRECEICCTIRELCKGDKQLREQLIGEKLDIANLDDEIELDNFMQYYHLYICDY